MMKKLIMFISGLILIVLTIGMLFLASAIYDSAKKSSVDTYFFQMDNLSKMRPGAPETPSEIGETTMREMLIRKYVNEYFYVIPDVENIAQRTRGTSTLARMSTPAVFRKWSNTMAEEIQTMAQNREMRIVDIDGEIYKPADSDYWVVPYVLYTWKSSNDMSVAPGVKRGTLLLNVFYATGTRDTIDIGNYLKHGYNRFESGYDPAAIFRFGVIDLENITDD